MRVSADDEVSARPDAARAGRVVLATVAVAFLVLVLPVVVRGGLLADDYHNCIRPQQVGYDGFLDESWDRLGIVRPARFVEIFVTAPLCERVPFGFVIAVPLAATFAVGWLARGLLRDLRVPAPWPELGAALWLLQPLGTEAALWPAALHVNLGLAFALGGMRLHLRGNHAAATLALLAACFSVEQVVLALPLALWMLAPPDRTRVVAVTTAMVGAVALAYSIWSGTDPRSELALGNRLRALVEDLDFYVKFPGVGIGAHSIPLAAAWALPVSIAAVVAAAWLGARHAPRLLHGVEPRPRPQATRTRLYASAFVVLVLLVNAPVLTTPNRGHDPRTFTPTWLVLAIGLSVAAAHVRWRRPQLAGAAAGTFAAGALLSIALSVSVRIDSARFTEVASDHLARHVPEGGTVAVCGVRRTVTTPAPSGSFALHELDYDWAAADSVAFHTGRTLDAELFGPMWDTACDPSSEVDLVVSFDDLVAGAGFGRP